MDVYSAFLKTLTDSLREWITLYIAQSSLIGFFALKM